MVPKSGLMIPTKAPKVPERRDPISPKSAEVLAIREVVTISQGKELAQDFLQLVLFS
jgi:hypothetical protein